MFPNAPKSAIAPRPRAAHAGPLLIAIGLALLLASAWLPALPLITAMAILTLGATLATIDRFAGSRAFAAILLLHGATYALLYGLFIAATLHASFDGTHTPTGTATRIDLALSTLPILIAVRHIATAARGV